MIAVNGTIWTGDISAVAGSSGTQIENVEGRVMPLTITTRQRQFVTNWGRDALSVFGGGAFASMVVELRAREIGSALLDLILAPYKVTGGGYASGGTGVEVAHEARGGVKLLVRPVDSSGLYLYLPNATLSPLPIIAQYSDDAPMLDGQSVQFAAAKTATSTEPAWYWGTPAQIAAAYSDLSAGA
jgi:hypothetical protein